MSATKSTAAKTQNTKAKSAKVAKLLTSTTLAAAGLMAMGAPANADNWTDHVADVGNISIDTNTPNITNITQYDQFVKVRGDGDINAGWTVNVMQPNVSSQYVLYDIEADPTMIMGTLNANGEIFIFDEQGTIFGKDSVVNVGALIASTGHISDADIQAQNFKFVDVNTGGKIENHGSITVAEGGLAALVAPQVINNGIITAKMGKVALASGDKVTLDLYGDNLIEIAVDDESTDGLIKNTGVIDAEAGVVAMSVQTAKSAVDDVINLGGIVNASSATVQGGKIVLSGGKSGTVKVENGAVLDVSGATGGGDIKITGETIAVDQETVLDASATENGNGGSIYLYGDDKTIFRGNAFALGGDESGNGGFVEISAGNEVGFDGFVSTLAPNGEAGRFLIDPQYSIIHSGWLNNLLGFELFLSSEALARSMENNGMVTVQADNTIDVGTSTLGWVPGVGTGDIDLSHYDYDTWGVVSTYQYWLFGWRTGYNYGWINHSGTTQANLTLDANTINFNKNLTIGKGNLTVDANTVNLNSKLYGLDTLGSTIVLGDNRISSNADLVNVKSNNALVQQGVWLADDAGGATVDVAAGTYNESVEVNKSLTLKGANDGLAGTDASRVAETVLKGTNNYSLLVKANDVTVDGLTIQGAVAGDGDAVWTQNADDLDFKNNIVLNATFGIISWGGAPVDGVIQDNLIANIAQHGIYIGENQYYDVLNNTLGDETHGTVRVGVTTENFWAASPTGDVTLIDGNKILASRIGIRNNLSYGTQSGFQISNNTINAGGDIGARWTGIDVISQQGGVATLFQNNNIEGAGAAEGKQSAAYEFTNMTSTNRAVVDGGFLKNTDVGVWVTDGSFYTGAVSDLLIRNVKFGYHTNYGILVENTNDPTNSGSLNVNATGTKVTLGEGNTFVVTPYDLAIAGDVTVALEGAAAGVGKTLVKAAGASNYVGSPSGTSVPQLYTTNASINTGIGATKAGGTVYVEDGSFSENVVVNKSLTLRSLNGRDATTIAGIANVGALGTVVVTDNVNGANIGAEDAGFTIVGFDNGFPGIENAALYFQGNHAGATVQDNRITAAGDEALVTEYGFNNSDFVIDGNIFDGKTYVGSSYATTGNQFEVPNRPRQLVALNKGLSNLTFTNNNVVGDAGSNQLVAIESNGSTVTGNTFDGETTSAALRVRGTNAVIADNTLTGNSKGVGIWTQNINGLTLGGANAEDGNTVSGFINGIVVDGGSGTTLVQNNTVTNNKDTDAGRSASDWQTGIGIFLKNMLGTVTVSDNTATGNTDGIRVQDTDPATLGAVTVSGNTASGNRDKGIILKRSDNIKVYDNTVNGNSIGIYADASSGALIQANDLNGNTADGIRLRDGSNNVRIENNWIHGSANGIYVDNSLANVSGVKVYDNSFAEADGSQANGKNIVNTTNNIVDASFNWWGTTSEAGVAAKITGLNKVDVSPYQGSGVDQQLATAGYQGTTSDLYVTDAGAQQSGLIQEAINAAVVNGTVNVNAGTYTENLLVWKGLKLNGLDGATLRYDVTNAGQGTAGNLITVTANNVNIDPFVFDGLGTAAYGVNASGADYLVVDGNTFQNFTQDGIRVENGNFAQLINNTINNVGGNGVLVSNGDDAVIQGNTINNAKVGILVVKSDRSTIGGLGAGQKNTITNVEDGIAVRADGATADGHLIQGNAIDGTTRTGIYAHNMTNSTIDSNVVKNTGRWASVYTLGGGNLTVSKNEVTHADEVGIRVENAGGTLNTVSGNLVSYTGENKYSSDGSNSGDGIQVINTAGAQVTGNSVWFANGDGIDVTNSASVQITGNAVGSKALGGGSYVNFGVNNVSGKGVSVQNSAAANVSNNVIFYTTNEGVSVSGSAGTTVSANYVDQTGGDAVQVLSSANARILGNQIGTLGFYFGANNIKGDGIYVDNSAGTWIQGNTITETYSATGGKGSGIHVNNSNNVLIGGATNAERNTITKADWDGVKIEGGSGVVVENNSVSNIDRVGIYAGNSQNLTIKKNLVSNTTGAIGSPYGGITVDWGSNINVSDNTVTGSGHGVMMYLNGGTNTVSGNVIYGVTNNGVNANQVAGLTVSDNFIGYTDKVGTEGANNNVGGNGVNVAYSDGAKINTNQIAKVAKIGINVDRGTGVSLTGNVLNKIGNQGVRTEQVAGLTLTGNDLNNVGWNAVQVEGGSAAVLTQNIVRKAGGKGLAVSGTNGVTVTDNTVTNTGESGVVVNDAKNVAIKGNVVHTVGTKSDSTLWNGIEAARITNGLEISGNFVGYINKTGTVGGANNIEGAGIVVKNTTNADVINNDIATALNGVVADTANGLDVYNNDIVGRGSSSGTGVKITNSSDVNVGDHDTTVWVKTGFWPWQGYFQTTDKDNRISSFDTGVSITGGTQNDVVNNTISNVHYGVKLSGTTNANVLDNSLTGNSVTGIDIVSGSHNATVQGNDISNFATGINIDGSNDVVIGGWDVALLGTSLFEGNNIDNVKNGIIANNAQRLKIQGNRIEQGTGANGGSGIQLKGSSDDAQIGGNGSWLTKLRANYITGFNDGIRLDNSDRTKVVQNKVEGAARDGIRLDRGDSNQVEGNNVSDVEGTGIWLNSQTNAVASGNRVNGTGLSGIRAEGSGSNHVDIINNRIDNTGTNGISAVGVADLDVLNNKIGVNGGNINGDGIFVDRSNGAEIKGNRINDTIARIDTVGNGISVKNSSNVEIGGEGSDRNVITNAEWDGIRVSGGDNVTVENNKVTGVDRVGVWMSGTTNSNVLDNVIRDTGLSGVRGEDGYNLTVDGNTIDQTGTHGVSADGLYGYLTVTGNQIGQNYADSIGSDGINVYDGQFVTIGGAEGARNNISGAQNGVVADYGYVVDVLNNNVTDVAYDGVRVTGFDYVNVNDNVITNAGDDGIEVGYADEARILRNIITTTGDDGIVAYDIGNSFMMPAFALLAEEGEGEGEGEESGDYYGLIISDNVITDAGQMYAGDDEGDDNSDGNDEGGEILRLSLVQELNGDGIDVYNSASTLIERNTVSHAYDDGIVVEGLGTGEGNGGSEGSGDFMPKMFDYYGFEPALVVIRDNDVTDSGADGIEVRNMAMSTIDINRVLNSGANGILASGFDNGDVVLTGNDLTDNKVGARFESGDIDLTGATNTITGGEVGLQFDPATKTQLTGWEEVFVPYGEGEGGYYDYYPVFETVSAKLNLVNDGTPVFGGTLGTTTFNGQSQYYVELLNGALFNPGTPTILNALNATFDGFRPSTVGGILSQAQYDAIEAKIYHYNDLNSLGLFFFGIVPNINDKDIYRALANFKPGNGPLNLTITGMPIIPGFSGNIGNFLNSITPAAGGNGQQPKKFASLVEQLANIAPAAGGNGQQGGNQQVGGQQQQQNQQQFGESTCWGDTMAAASGGTIVNMTFGSDPSAALDGAASCQTGI